MLVFAEAQVRRNVLYHLHLLLFIVPHALIVNLKYGLPIAHEVLFLCVLGQEFVQETIAGLAG